MDIHFLTFVILCALSFVILQYEACAINSFRITIIGNGSCVMLHLYAIPMVIKFTQV